MSIYEIVTPFLKENTGSKEKLKEWLRSNLGIFYTAKYLAKVAGYPATNTNPELRKAITELIEIYHLPIVSSSKGFAWASNDLMIRKCKTELHERMTGLLRRITSY